MRLRQLSYIGYIFIVVFVASCAASPKLSSGKQPSAPPAVAQGDALSADIYSLADRMIADIQGSGFTTLAARWLRRLDPMSLGYK